MRGVVDFNRRLIHRMLIQSNWTRRYQDIIKEIEEEMDVEERDNKKGRRTD